MPGKIEKVSRKRWKTFSGKRGSYRRWGAFPEKR